MRTLARISPFFVWTAMATIVAAATPQYQIFDIGVIQAGDTAAQGFGASPGGVAVGRSVRSNASQAFSWTVGGGLVGLPNLAGRNHAVSNDANDNGIVVGTAATTLFGSSRLPVIWNNGVVSQLPLPAGETLGDANGVNASGIAVGSVDAGSFQQAVIYNGANATVITQTTSTGCFFLTAFGINDSGRIVGQGIDPNNAARNVGIVYDMGNASAFEVGALPGANGALAFAVGNGGHVVGSSMMNQGSGLPFIWSSATGMVAVPLAAGTSQGSARGVNSAGWVVGQDSSAFSIPFLWDGTTTYRLADLLPAGSGWDLSMNTSSSALGISDSGIIVGTGVHNDEVHAYAMVPVQATPTPTPTPGPATHFTLTAPQFVISGTPFNFTVTAKDSANNTATGYPGTVHFTSSNVSAILPPDSTLTNGTGTFQATLHGPNSETITATDTLNSSITGTSNPIPVVIGDPTPTPSPTSTPTPTPTPSPTPVPPTPTPTPFCVLDTWSATTTTGAPSGRFSHTAVWTGNEMIVWGGLVSAGPVFTNTGGKYNPVTDSWTATSTTNAPSARGSHTAVWTGTEMIIWGGPTGTIPGGRYNPSTNTWTATSLTNAPASRGGHTAIWTGSEMIVWGGFGTGGAKYNPSTDTWTPTSTVNAPADRHDHIAVWTGTEMIIWGGSTGGGAPAGAGAKYNPSTDTWTLMSTVNAPADRTAQTGVWTGSEMIVWGGSLTDSTGGRYNPATDSWTPTSITNAPAPRYGHSAVWTGLEMIVWGGAPATGTGCLLTDGGRYNPALDTWTPIQTANAPQGRNDQTEVWTGRQMIVWGGSFGDTPCPDSYQPALPNFWNTGGKYCAEAGPTPTPTPTSPTPTPTATPPSSPTPTPSPTPASSPTKALNLSTRMRVQTGNNVGIGGFIITGNASKNVAIRGIGPSLSAFGITDALSDPTLELRDSNGGLIKGNDDWQDNAADAAQLTSLGLAPQNPKESGLVATLQPGSAYTAILAGKNQGVGVGLVEIYDVNPAADSQMANISTRSFVLTGSDVTIAGFILGGNNNTGIVVRGLGPSLAQFGLNPVLADPTLELHDGNGATLISNDNWADDPTSAAQLIALGLAPQNMKEAALATSLPPGACTAILAGANSGIGIGLVEVYNVH